jgi:hypothetical protein
MQTLHLTVRTQPIDLSGASTYESLYTAENDTNVRTMRVIYDEATSADAGVAIRIGKIGDADYFTSLTTEVSKAAGSVVYLSKTNNILVAGETLTVECDGGKDGAGTVSIQIELNHTVYL